jgi:Transglutaminase-like superfamily
MNIFQKLFLFFSIDTRKQLLFLEAFIYLGIARVLKIIPFSKVAPSLGESLKETTYNPSSLDIDILKNITEAIHIMSNYTIWESQCLVKAIAGMKMLERRQIESTLYLGVAKDGTGKLIAHAWLRSGQFYISGSEGMERFSVVGMFAKRMNSKDKSHGKY